GGLRFLLTYAPEKLDSSYAQLLVTVDDYRSIAQLADEIQDHLDQTLTPGMAIVKPFQMGPGEGGKIQVRFSGPDPTELRKLTDEAMAIMRADRDREGNPGAKGIRTDWRQRQEVVQPELAEEQAQRTGITKRDLANATKYAFDGLQAGVYRENASKKASTLPEETRVIPIIARPPENERADVKNVQDALVFSPVTGKMLPMRQVASGFETVWEDSVIQRRNRIPTITVHCDPRRGNASVVLERIMPKIKELEKSFPPGYFLEWGGEYEDSANAQAGLARSIPGFLVLMVFVVICLFNALRQPAIIFLCVPLALIGVTLGLLVTRQPFGFMSLLGALSLSGMLIKNAIVLLDEIGVQIRGGMAPYPAIVRSSVSRMRPVMMAALTTVLGMLPLLLDAFFISMAVTIMFGLTFATLLTLIVVPVLYAIFFRVPCKETA
ncbi:MAG: efflux RND transporter permease subunit, partial [Pirellulales bacterium]|nr:efflux RND transporter permease subunit [Pirellulales bacterium]